MFVQLFVQQHGVMAGQAAARYIGQRIVGVPHPDSDRMKCRAGDRPCARVAGVVPACTRLCGDGKGQNGKFFRRSFFCCSLHHVDRKRCRIFRKGADGHGGTLVEQRLVFSLDFPDKGERGKFSAARESRVGTGDLAQGEAFADTSESERKIFVFSFYGEPEAAQRAGAPFRSQHIEHFYRRYIHALCQRRAGGDPSAVPVFIVGRGIAVEVRLFVKERGAGGKQTLLDGFGIDERF